MFIFVFSVSSILGKHLKDIIVFFCTSLYASKFLIHCGLHHQYVLTEYLYYRKQITPYYNIWALHSCVRNMRGLRVPWIFLLVIKSEWPLQLLRFSCLWIMRDSSWKRHFLEPSYPPKITRQVCGKKLQFLSPLRTTHVRRSFIIVLRAGKNVSAHYF